MIFGKCLCCGITTDLPHAESLCGSCYSQPWKLRDLVEIGAKWRNNSSLAEWFPLTAEHLQIVEWLCAGKYRSIAHRHDGTFRLRDEALNIEADGDSLESIVSCEWWPK